jgi:RNA recognition motif-containing protein
VHIFVGHLALTTTEQDLRELFEPYGSVDAIRIMTDRETGRSQGCGFVEMPDSHVAQTAIDALNGTSLAGRALTVPAAVPREPRRAPRQPR